MASVLGVEQVACSTGKDWRGYLPASANSFSLQATGCAEQIRLSKPKQEREELVSLVGECARTCTIIVNILWLLTCCEELLARRAKVERLHSCCMRAFFLEVNSTFKTVTCSSGLDWAHGNH